MFRQPSTFCPPQLPTLPWKGTSPCYRLALEGRASDPALTNDRLERSDSKFRVIGNGNGHGAEIRSALHYDVASALADDLKPVLFENAADVSSGQDAKFTHGPLRSG